MYEIPINRGMESIRMPVQKDAHMIEEPDICPECQSSDLKFDSQKAEISCRRCGYVLEDSIVDLGQEWRAFNHEQRAKRTRVGAPTTPAIADRGLPTEMGKSNRDINGRSIPERNRFQYNRLRKLNKRIRISGTGERNLAIALSELDRQSSRLGLPRFVREDAAIIYRLSAKKNIVRGRSIEGMVAASIYTAARRCNLPRTLDEVSEASNVKKKQIGKNYRFIARELDIKLRPTSPADYIPRFASVLGLSGEIESKAINIINQSKEKGLLTGREPTGVAAATLYLASMLLGVRVTQKDVAEIANVSEVTIRNRYKEFCDKLNLSAF